MIVVDTNTLAYFVIESDRTAEAEFLLRKDPEWAAPQLWRSELRNVLGLYVKRREFDLASAVERMEQAEKIVGVREYAVESGRVLELAQTSGCTAYDCEFVYLAEKLAVPLVTSDKKLLAAFPNIATSMDAFIQR